MANIFKNFDAKNWYFRRWCTVRYSRNQDSGKVMMRKIYANCTAAVLRAKSCVMKVVTSVQENAEDIYAEAQQINEEREAKAAVVEDEEVTETAEETEETEEEDFTEA